MNSFFPLPLSPFFGPAHVPTERVKGRRGRQFLLSSLFLCRRRSREREKEKGPRTCDTTLRFLVFLAAAAVARLWTDGERERKVSRTLWRKGEIVARFGAYFLRVYLFGAFFTAVGNVMPILANMRVPLQ